VNYRIIAKLLGLLLLTFGASMAPALGWSLYYRDGAATAIVAAMAATVAAGGLLFLIGRPATAEDIFRREATATVSVAWILSALAGALPYYFADLAEMGSFADCFFESMSGLTTTGASVLTDIEAVPPGLLFWRSWTHWVGGIGIIMLFVAVLPYLGAGGRALVKSEITGPVKEGLTPRIKDTALLLARLYIGYTIAQTLLLLLAGLSLFDALCHTFGTLGTGGFSTKNDSIAHFDASGAVEVILIVFMILSASNFALMHGAFRGRIRTLWRDGEWRFFMIVIFGSAFFLSGLLLSAGTYAQADRALRDSLFTVVSLVTTTGFVTADFDLWPTPAKFLLVSLMFMGGCAGSTSGGLKMLRCLLLLKVVVGLIEKVFRPRSIRQVRVGDSVISTELQFATLGYFAIFWMVFAVGGFAFAVIEMGEIDLVTAFTTIASMVNNIGPGLGQVGAVENYGFLAASSKVLLSVMMLAGRLEFYSVLVLLAPGFWRSK
jgi:trk system potassium uptake protein